VPASIVGNVLCGRYTTGTPAAVWHWVAGHLTVLIVLTVAVVGLRCGWALARRLVWRHRAATGTFLEIVPPITATPAATVGLWRLLATLLAAPSWWTLAPARLVWEVAADPRGMRCGLWMPAGLTATAVERVVHRAWPGARLTTGPAPDLRARLPVAGRVLGCRRPDWLPLLDDPPTARGHHLGTGEGEDRVRAVFDGLAAAGRTGGGLLQVVVSRPPRRRAALARRAVLDPARGRRRGAARSVSLLAGILTGVLRAVLDLVQPTAGHGTQPRGPDPYLAGLAGEARAKLADAPQLLAVVRAVAAGPTRAAAKAACADITSGFSLLSAHLTPRRLTRPRTALGSRVLPDRDALLASVSEVAALAAVPAEPPIFGLPAAASRRRAPTRDAWRHTAPRSLPSSDQGRASEPDPWEGGAR
jgi:hypothetical protein